MNVSLFSWQFWITLGTLLLVCEILTPGFWIACIGIGALTTTITSLLTNSIYIQLSSFIISSILSVIFIRPFITKITNRPDSKSGMDAIIGRVVTVYEDISSDGTSGSIKCDGDIWRAISKKHEFIPKGTQVVIKSYNSLIVEVESIYN